MAQAMVNVHERIASTVGVLEARLCTAQSDRFSCSSDVQQTCTSMPQRVLLVARVSARRLTGEED